MLKPIQHSLMHVAHKLLIGEQEARLLIEECSILWKSMFVGGAHIRASLCVVSKLNTSRREKKITQTVILMSMLELFWISTHAHTHTQHTHTHKNPLAASNSVEGVHNLGTQMGQLQISTSRGGTATYSGQPQHTTQYHISTAHGTQYAHQTPTGWTIQHTPIVQQVKCCGTLECRLCTPDFSVMEMNFGNPFFKPVGQNLEQKAWNQGCQH